MKRNRSPRKMGLAVLAGGLSFVGNAAELIIDGSFENTTPSSNPVVKVGGKPNPGVGEGWSSFSTYTYSTLYTLPGPANSGIGYLRPYPPGTYGISQSSTEAKQLVSLLAGTLTPAKIDAGSGKFTMSSWFSSYLTQGDFSELTLEFLNEANAVVGDPIALGGRDFVESIPTGANSKYGNAKEWGQDVETGTIPSGARRARVTIKSTPVNGAPDGYVDVVSLDVVDTALAIPALTAADPGNNAVGVGPVVNLSVTLQDRATAVNTNAIQLFLDNVLVSPSIQKVETNTTVKYSAGVLPALSPHTYRIVFGDTGSPSARQTNEFKFTVADFLTLPATLKTPLGSEDTSKPGFNVGVYQVDALPDGTQLNLPASIAFSETVLAGLVGPNVADLSAASATNTFAAPGTINWINSSGATANFPNDEAFPGIPGSTGTEDNFVNDIRTFIRFPAAGYYQMGINNEDQFRLTAAMQGVQTLRITAPTNMAIPCVPIATNITQLQFGGSLPLTPLAGALVYATPTGDPEEACSIGTRTNLAGKIVLLDRGAGGTCSSAAKAEQAQLAGALAVIETTPGDTGFPMRLDDISANVRIPVLVISEKFGGTLLKSYLTKGTPVNVTIQGDPNPRIAEWDGPKGFGAVDVTFGFAVPEAGLYPMRLVAGQEVQRANLEWFSIKPDGTRFLINDTSIPDSLRAFRARTGGASATFDPVKISGGNITIAWTGSGTLEEANSILGPWTTSPNQGNPQTVPAAAGMKFYRIRQ
jgi:hypothetical protein